MQKVFLSCDDYLSLITVLFFLLPHPPLTRLFFRALLDMPWLSPLPPLLKTPSWMEP